jgi:polyferredoxin
MRAKKAPTLRRAVQIFFFVLIALIAVNHSLEQAGRSLPLLSSASLHALCPFGGVVSVYQVLAGGTFVKKVHSSAFVLMYIGFGLALLFGPVFCGWVCPLGGIQEWLGRLGRRLFGKRYNRLLPRRLDMRLRYLRYAVLAWVLYMTAVTGVLVFSDYDPYFTLFNFWTGEAALSGFVILGAVLVLSLFVERPFCKYACPYGALLGLFNLFRVFKIRRSAATCIDCKRCDRACPMNIEVSHVEAVRHHQCITCLECSSESACPVAATVELTTFRLDSAEEKKAEQEAAV